ncbi:MAG: MGH1-like glycoside hydrolase domain-containing protein [Chloroflexota bacterium]
MDYSALRQESVDVLRENDLGGWTRPAPRLYPHQWSWDSAFIAIGLAHLDPHRALLEIDSLLKGQWADGRIPHIVYNPDVPADAYFPDAERWNCPAHSPLAPSAPLTSGIIQPPVHALALARILAIAGDQPAIRDEIARMAVRLLHWHRYLAQQRDPKSVGLITIYHPWESGTDNSPRWDAPLAHVEVGQVRPYVRRDLAHVADPSQRPSHAEYDRYVWLVESLASCGYDDTMAHRQHPFLVKDVLFSAVFATASQVLADIHVLLGLSADSAHELRQIAQRFTEGVAGAWDSELELALDLDLLTGQPIPVVTWAGLAPLLLPDADASIVQSSARRLASRDFTGHPDLAFAVVPSTAPATDGFREATYWRGPSWPVANYLLWRGLRGHRLLDAAEALRGANLDLLNQPGSQCAEYFHPFTGAPLGSAHQSWTAAAVIDWLAEP